MKETASVVKSKDLISCRAVLWCLFFSGCIINYMLKISLNLVIVAMVVPRASKGGVSECISTEESTNLTMSLIPSSTFVPPTISYDDRFYWTEYEQGLALSAFYWSYWSTHVPGGLLAQRYGTKLVFGAANFLASLVNLLTPFAINYHLYAFLFLRVLQGAIMGGVCPSMHVMTAKWIPPDDRSKFISAYMGGSIGTALTYFLCALIIHYFNWETAFYTTSLIGIVWYCFWLYFAYDSPQQHPRITRTELKYIMENNPATMMDNKKRPVPWKSILTSGPFWVTVIAHWGATWGFYTLLAQGPTYFSFIHGWDINMTGIIAGAPHIILMIFSYGFGAFSDWLLRQKKMTRTGVRKLATMITTGIQAIFIIGLSFSGCHSTFAVFFMIAGTVTTGALSSGSMANLVDLSPNHCSVLLGICGLIANGAGAISPLIVGILTNGNQTIGQWRIVFLIAAANLAICGAIFMVWGTAQEQPWNDFHNVPCDAEHGEELQKLKAHNQAVFEACSQMAQKKLEKEKEANRVN